MNKNTADKKLDKEIDEYNRKYHRHIIGLNEFTDGLWNCCEVVTRELTKGRDISIVKKKIGRPYFCCGVIATVKSVKVIGEYTEITQEFKEPVMVVEGAEERND